MSSKYTFRSRHRPKDQRKPAEPAIDDPHNNHVNSSSSDEALQRRKLRFQAQPQTQDYGFVSRGETRLKESESERRKYFAVIVLSFLKLCDEATRTEVRERIDVNSIHSSDGNMTMDGVLTSLRKLREAILGTKPSSFSKKVLLFSVRVAVPLGHYQTYVPSITQLLAPGVDISRDERQELVVLLLLHWAHFSNENSRALLLLLRGCPEDTRTRLLLQSWIGNDYYRWLNLYKAEEDTLRVRIMKFGLPKVLQHLVNAINVSYFNLPLAVLQEYLPQDMLVQDLVAYGAQWLVDGSNVVIRVRKTAKAA